MNAFQEALDASSAPITSLVLNIRRDVITVQGLIIDTSCDQPLYLNDRFGSLMVFEYVASQVVT